MRRRHRGTLTVGLLLGCALGCAEHRPFDSATYLRERYAEQLTTAAAAGIDVTRLDAAGIDVPFALDAELERLLAERLPPVRSDEERVQGVVDFIFRELGLRYALTPTRDAAGTFRAREGNCLSFANLFVGIARQQRLNPFYVEVADLQTWRHRQGAVVSQGHVVAGLYVGGELRTFDFLPYRPKAYRDLRIIDDLEAVAHYYNNLGAEALLAGDPGRAERLLRTAHALAPGFPKATNNLGVALARQGRLDEAAALYRRGLERAPDSVALLTNLAGASQQLGRADEAAALFDRLEELRETSPYYFVYRAELALGEDEPQRALGFLREALRRDSEIPEVHVGLAKVYLALGDLRRARHHLDRALLLDASNDEAQSVAKVLEPAR